jgi:ubiquinone/menaquinone biosynthesis C-methylase UbiE
MINYRNSYRFWESRGRSVNNKQITSLSAAMLVSDDRILKYRDFVEKSIFLRKIKINKDYSVLDLGCGTGRWALFLAPKVMNITAVDFSESFIKIAKNNAKRLNIKNVQFVKNNIIDYKTNNKFDIIYNGGVFQYLNDRDLNILLNYLISRLKKNGVFVSRDSVNLKKRIYLSGRYEVIYRSERELISTYTSKNLKFINSFESMPPRILFRFYKILPNFMHRNIVLNFFTKLSITLDSLLRFSAPLFYCMIYLIYKITGRFEVNKFYLRHKFYIFKKLT